MVTPNQITEKTLSTAAQGYDIDETNAFLNEIAESYAAVYAENKELYRKLEVLAEKVEEYRNDEDTIKAAVITAQKAADSLKKSAKEKAEQLISDSASSAHRTVLNAKEKAEKLISDARDYATSLTRDKSQAANEIIEEAEKKANTALKSARVVAQDIIENAKNTSDEVIAKASDKKDYYDQLADKLREESSTFKNNMISLYETQLKKLREMMEDVDNAAPEAIKVDNTKITNDIKTIFTSLNDIDASSYKADVNAGIPDINDNIEDESSAIDDKIEEMKNNVDFTPEEEKAPEAAEETEEVPVEESAEDASAASYVDIDSAIDSFTANYYKPQEVHVNTEDADEIEVVDNTKEEEPAPAETQAPAEEPAQQNDDGGSMPFEKFFNVDSEDEQTDEKISLVAPDEEEEDEDLKFRGFFKKKKDKNK